MSDLDLDALEAQYRSDDGADGETVCMLIAEVRRLRVASVALQTKLDMANTHAGNLLKQNVGIGLGRDALRAERDRLRTALRELVVACDGVNMESDPDGLRYERALDASRALGEEAWR